MAHVRAARPPSRNRVRAASTIATDVIAARRGTGGRRRARLETQVALIECTSSSAMYGGFDAIRSNRRSGNASSHEPKTNSTLAIRFFSALTCATASAATLASVATTRRADARRRARARSHRCRCRDQRRRRHVRAAACRARVRRGRSVSARGISVAAVTDRSSDQNSREPVRYATGSPAARRAISASKASRCACASSSSACAYSHARGFPSTCNSRTSASSRASSPPRHSAAAAAITHAACRGRPRAMVPGSFSGLRRRRGRIRQIHAHAHAAAPIAAVRPCSERPAQPTDERGGEPRAPRPASRSCSQSGSVSAPACGSSAALDRRTSAAAVHSTRLPTTLMSGSPSRPA